MEIIPEVGKKQRNSDLPEGSVNTLCPLFLRITTLYISSEHSSRDSNTYLPPSLGEGVETTILKPSDAGSRESLGCLAGNHDPSAGADIHIGGQALRLMFSR